MQTRAFLDGFIIDKVDESDATYNYYGYQAPSGACIIFRETKTATPTQYLYAIFSNTTDYDAVWTSKQADKFTNAGALPASFIRNAV
jgi:hypothetical protein